MAIPSIEEDTDNPPVSLDDFRARIAADVDVGMTYQRLEQLETRYGYLAAFLGLEPDTGLELATATAYAQSIESAQGELDTELVGIIDRVADLHRRSHETYLSSGAELDLDGVDEAAAARRLAELEASWETMSGLQDEVDALSTLQERAATIIGIRNEDTAAKQATESLSLDFLKLPDPAPRGTVDVLDLHIRSAKALLSLADDAMLHNMSVVEDHMTSLESIRFQNAAAEELARVEKAKGALSELHDTVTAKSDEAEKTHTVNLQTLADGVKDIDGDRTNFVMRR